jgi:hypothetical protein
VSRRTASLVAGRRAAWRGDGGDDLRHHPQPLHRADARWLFLGAMAMKRLGWLVAGAALLAFEALAATDAELLRCRAIADTAARLACYDALPAGQAGGAAAPAAVAPAAASPGATSPAAGGAAAAAATAPAPADPAASFGLEKRARAAATEAIESYIPGRFAGWEPGSRIRLANGQVWRIADGSRGTYWLENPRVRVERAMFGTFRLEIIGQGHAPRVERVE